MKSILPLGNKNSLYALDFFCGAGGLTRGLMDAGIKVVAGIDDEAGCRETYEKNNAPAEFIQKDIAELTISEIEKLLRGHGPSDLMLAACAPCQPFTKQRTARKKGRMKTLLGYFAKFVDYFEPDCVFVENVPGISKVEGNSTYRRFLRVLKNKNYFFDAADVDAKDYGVPQTRNRHILLARKSFPVKIPKQLCGHDLSPYRTVRQTIARFPKIEAGEAHPTVPNHRASNLSAKNLERLNHTPPDGGDRRCWPDFLILDCHKKNYSGHTDVYGRMWWDRPAPALTCKCHSLSNGRYGHPEQNRAISLREAAALQTFPDDYIFYGPSKESIGNQIGNAVPVKLAEIIGRAFLS